MNITKAITKIAAKNDLGIKEMQAVMEDILNGKVSTPDIVEFLTYLNEKGETADELTAAADRKSVV